VALDECADQAAFDEPNATGAWLAGADGHVWVR